LSALLLTNILHQLLYAVYLRLKFLIWLNPLSVQIDPRYRASIVSAHHAIWVQGRNQYEGVELSQEFGLWGGRTQEVIDAFEDIAGGGLRSVNPAGYDNYWLLFISLAISTYRYLINRKTAYTPCHYFSLVEYAF
jgi:hypothetical protein